MNTAKISIFGKIIAAASCILAIVMVTGTWLDLYQVPMIFGDSVQHEYSIFEITDFLDTFNMYLENSDVKTFSTLLTFCAVIIIVMSFVTIILTLLGNKYAKISAIVFAVMSLALTALFIGTIMHINQKMEKSTYGGIEELLRSTGKPYWLIVFAILSLIGTCLKAKNTMPIKSYTQIAPTQNIKCEWCGAMIDADAQFCTYCGKQVEIKTAPLPEPSRKRFCISCGAEITGNEHFCVHCGAKLD